MADLAIAPSAESVLPEAKPPSQPWPLLQRLSFRFLCCYFTLYDLPSLISSIPGAAYLVQPYTRLWDSICPWVAIHLFHLSGQATTWFPTGSGDTTLAYVENLLFLVFSLTGALAWSLVDYKRPDYRWLHPWLRLLVRYTLALALFRYGFAKVFPSQFQPPSFERLMKPYGQFSPMGVLWSFMGASTPYVIFSGASEVLGGSLLLFRRTASLGAMISFGVLLNVAVLNFCYDVPVKLYSTNLVLMSLFLLAPDLRRLARVLLLNRAAAPADLAAPRFERLWLRRTASAFWVLFVACMLFTSIMRGWAAYKQYNVDAPRPPLYGLYDVESFSRNGQEVPLLITDTTRWRKVAITRPQSLSIRMMDDSTIRYDAAYDTNKNTVTLNTNDVLAWSCPDPAHVLLEGTISNDTVVIRLNKLDTSKFLLVSRGFHWITEIPFNR